MASETEPVRKDNSSPDASGKPDIRTSDPKPNIPLRLSGSSLPPSKPHCEITCKTEKNWWDKLKPFVEIAGAILLAVYTGYTIKMYHANKQAADAAALGAQAAKESADLARKQMEGVGAAIVEIAGGSMTLNFPATTNGELRANLVNSGHVIAHDTHFYFSLTLQEIDGNADERMLLSKTETVPAIAPTAVVPRPDLIYPFELSRVEHERVMKTMDYLIAKGSLDYENGFGTRVTQPFCCAYIWADMSPRFGRWQGPCDQTQMQIRAARASTN